MEPGEFCKPCDSRSSGGRVCIVEEIYPRKGYCPTAIVGGMSAEIDCSAIHLEGKVVLQREDPRLNNKILRASKERMERFVQLSGLYSNS